MDDSLIVEGGPSMRKLWTLIVLLLLVASTATAHDLERVGVRFHYHGTVVNPGSLAEGALMNSRMANAIWDDAGWAAFDADKNTSNFIAALPTYASYGLNNVTVSLQGGKTGRGQSVSTGINPNGSFDGAWMARLDRVLSAAVAKHMTVTVQGYYQSQDHRVIGDEAVKRSLVNIVKWIYARGYQDDVIFEVANEANPNLYSHHPILQRPNVHQAITIAKNARPDNVLAVTVSFVGGALPTANVYKVADVVVLHGNGRTATELKAMIDKVRANAAYKARPVPILVNEDSTNIENLNASLSKGVGWGYWDQSGFQAITDTDGPVWNLNTSTKQAFFNRVKEVTN
jgi:hypothetical protein